MRLNVRLAPGVFAIVTNGPRNHLVTVRRKGFLSELHYPAALFWAEVERHEIYIIKEARRDKADRCGR